MVSRLLNLFELAAVGLPVAVAVGLFAAVFREALATRLARSTALVTIPFWAKTYLALISAAAVGMVLLALGLPRLWRIDERIEFILRR